MERQLTEEQKRTLIDLINRGETLPSVYKTLLFAPDDTQYVEVTGVYQLNYCGKAREQDILAETPAAPLQEMRAFNVDNPREPGRDDGWRNMLIYGDNLLALKTLYEDQRGPNLYRTKNRIKLVYIDPPFATKQDFMKDREKAYRDKLIGAQFIEFLRKRLVLLREVLADDGSIFVHLDWKKGHYIKVIMDEIFGEHNFSNEIVWYYYNKYQGNINRFASNHDAIFWYRKSEDYTFEKLREARESTAKQIKRVWDKEKGALVNAKGPDGKVIYIETDEKTVDDVWRISMLQPAGKTEALDYPKKKPEHLLERIIRAASSEVDIVLDAFAGSGTTLAVAEKLGRRWIGMDCGRLAMYTIQKRMLNLSTLIGSEKKDGRREFERVPDFEAHSKSGAKAALLLYDKIKNGEFEITDTLLTDLAAFIEKYSSLPRRSRGREENGLQIEFSLMCHEDKFKMRSLPVEEASEADKVGKRLVAINNVLFRVSFIETKNKTERGEPLRAKEFVLYNAGVYDRAKIRALPWNAYKPFVMQLFGVRPDKQHVHALEIDGFIGTDPAIIWNYPDHRDLVLDEGYVESLHDLMRGQAGDKFYIIAPVPALAFMTDELRFGKTRYIILKVPESILYRLLESGRPGALQQPFSKEDVNEVIDAVGFDFISQPLTEQEFLLLPPENENLLNRGTLEPVVRVKEFRSKTFSIDPDNYPNFATLSMILVDTDYNGDVFNLAHVFWADNLVNEELKRLDKPASGEFKDRAGLCERLDIRIPIEEMEERIMVILIDQYGHEKRLAVEKKEFRPSRRKRVSARAMKKK